MDLNHLLQNRTFLMMAKKSGMHQVAASTVAATMAVAMAHGRGWWPWPAAKAFWTLRWLCHVAMANACAWPWSLGMAHEYGQWPWPLRTCLGPCLSSDHGHSMSYAYGPLHIDNGAWAWIMVMAAYRWIAATNFLGVNQCIPLCLMWSNSS